KISGSGGLTKLSSSELALETANDYTGNTLVAGGVLKANNSIGSATGPGSVTVSAGAYLQGNGSVAGPVNLSGTIAAGNSIGTLSTGPLTLNGGASAIVEIGDATGAAGTGFDQINVNGGIDVQATSGNPVTIQLISLQFGSPGRAQNFSEDSSYLWTIAVTSDSVMNFAADKFSVNDLGFMNDLAGGYFFVEAGSLKLGFTNNHPPVANAATYWRAKGTSVKINISELLANATSDADGDSRILVGVGTASHGA